MSNTASTKPPFLSNKAFDSLKWIAQLGLPGLGTFYFALANIWHFPFGEEVVGTITALDVLLGLWLFGAARRYNNSDAKYDGSLVVDTRDPAKDSYLLDLDELPSVPAKQTLTLKVTSPE